MKYIIYNNISFQSNNMITWSIRQSLQLLCKTSNFYNVDVMLNFNKFLPKIQLNLNYTPSVALGGYSPLQLTRRHHFRTSIHILNPMGRVNRAVQDFNELVIFRVEDIKIANYSFPILVLLKLALTPPP